MASQVQQLLQQIQSLRDQIYSQIPPHFVNRFINLSNTQILIIGFSVITFVVVNISFFRLASVLGRETAPRRPKPSPQNPTHLLVVLGSGGHTAEMLNILQQQTPLLQIDYTYRTYVVSSGDHFSASKAVEFEKELLAQLQSEGMDADATEAFDVVTVRRARHVHQGLLTAPFSTLQCLLDCISVLRGRHPDLRVINNKSISARAPDLILTNGPGTGVCVVLAAIILLFIRGDSSQMRTIYIESWARVKTLSLSGKILKPFVDRFIVQWPDLVENEGSRVEYIGPLVS